MRKKITGLLLVLLGVIVITMEVGSPDQSIYLPLIFTSPVASSGSGIDVRFGIAEMYTADMIALGFPTDGRFHGRQWARLEHNDTAVFLRSAHRDHPESQVCYMAYKFSGRPDYCADPSGNTLATETGWGDLPGLITWLKSIYIVGNELTIYNPVGDDVTPEEYAVWYHDAWTTIKAEQPSAIIAPYGPTQGTTGKSNLLAVWNAYKTMWSESMQTDFYPLHFYLPQGFCLSEQIAEFESLVAFMESHRGIDWNGPKDYRLLEYGMPVWDQDISEAELLSCMDGFTNYLMTNDIGVSQWAWWGHPFSQEAALVKDGQPTALGQCYYNLATGQACQ